MPLKHHYPVGSEANPEREPSQYMFLFRHGKWDEGLSAEEIMKIMEDVRAWFDALAKAGKVAGGSPLMEGGKTVRIGNGGASVSDGPFVESKEAVAGYLLLRVDSMEEAVEIAKTSPLLRHDATMTTEVREIAPECPVYVRLREMAAAV